MKKIIGIYFALIFCGVSHGPITGNLMAVDNINVVEDPKPTHVEKVYVNLKLVKEIKDEIDDEHFFARPSYLAPDADGNIYVFDTGLTKIIVLDKNLKFVRMFLDKGKGPGEVMGIYSNSPNMSVSPDGHLYLSSPRNNKVIVFSKDGKMIKEIKTPFGFHKSFFRPVVDSKGNVYVHSDNGGAVDIFDSSSKMIKTLLTPDAFRTFVLFPPPEESLDSFLTNGPLDTFFDTMADDHFIIFLTNSSTIYLFKDQRPIRQFNVWPEKLFTAYRESYERSMKAEKGKKRNWSIPFCLSFFVDKDDNRHFYIESSLGYRSLYKFNLNGELIAVLRTEKERGNFLAKRNGLFYGIHKNDGRVFIYKEDK